MHASCWACPRLRRFRRGGIDIERSRSGMDLWTVLVLHGSDTYVKLTDKGAW